MKFRPAAERGHQDYGWLEARYTFSFGEYYDPDWMGWRCLRVMNEDRIAGQTGFPSHPHQEMEIVTIMLSGSLSHEDSTGSSGVIQKDEVQVMSAGRGIVHSEKNAAEENAAEEAAAAAAQGVEENAAEEVEENAAEAQRPITPREQLFGIRRRRPPAIAAQRRGPPQRAPQNQDDINNQHVNSELQVDISSNNVAEFTALLIALHKIQYLYLIKKHHAQSLT